MLDILRRLIRNEHEWVHENLSPYLDGMVSPRESTRIDKHLAQCTDCRAELGELKQMVSLLAMVPEMPLPRSFLVPLSEGREASARGFAWGFGAWRTASAIASFMLVAVVSINLAFRAGMVNLSSQPAADGIAPLMITTESEAPQIAEMALEKEAPVEKVVVETLVVEKEVAAEQVPMERTAKLPPRVEATDAAAAPEVAVASAAKELEAAPETAAEKMEAKAPQITVGGEDSPMAENRAATPTLAAQQDAETSPVMAADSTYDEGQRSQLEVASRPSRTRRPGLPALLDVIMWVLLIATIALWAVTATISKQKR
jgi:hypothetical protein